MARETTSKLEPGKRRDREDRTLHARKKGRTMATELSEKVDFQDEALQLEENVLGSQTNYNSIHTILKCLHQEDEMENEKIIAAVALCRIFCKLMARGSLGKPKESSGNEVTIIQWLRERLHDCEQGLLRMLKSKSIRTQSTALTILMRLLKEQASHLNQSADIIWQGGLFWQLIQSLVEAEIFDEIRNEFVENYIVKYEDVRFYTLACLAYVPMPL